MQISALKLNGLAHSVVFREVLAYAKEPCWGLPWALKFYRINLLHRFFTSTRRSFGQNSSILNNWHPNERLKEHSAIIKLHTTKDEIIVSRQKNWKMISIMLYSIVKSWRLKTFSNAAWPYVFHFLILWWLIIISSLML